MLPQSSPSSALRFRFASLASIFGNLPPLPGKLRLVDAIARFVRLLRSPVRVSSPFPGVHFAVDLDDRIQRQMWAACYEQHVTR